MRAVVHNLHNDGLRNDGLRNDGLRNDVLRNDGIHSYGLLLCMHADVHACCSGSEPIWRSPFPCIDPFSHKSITHIFTSSINNLPHSTD